MVILPDVAPENAVKASLKADEMPPEFSFGYESDKKKEEKQENTASNSNSSSEKATTQQHSSGSSADSGLTQGSGINVVGPQTTTTGVGMPASPQDPPRGTHVASPAPSTSSEQQTSSALPVAPTPPQQPQTHTMTRPLTQARPAVNSRSPIWLDALILGFGGLLLAMVIRRFL